MSHFKNYDDYKKNRKNIIFNEIQSSCHNSSYHIAIIIPYRNRLDHLEKFIEHFNNLNYNNSKIDVYIIDQNNADKFNRGLLLNIGFIIAKIKQIYDRYIFHDVDSFPDQEMFNLYFDCIKYNIHYASPKLKYKYTFENFFGGIIGFNKADFELINGFPNTFFGWGGEDDALYNRCAYNNIQIYRPISGSFILIDHLGPTSLEYNYNKKKNILDDIKQWKNNGLRQLLNFFINIKKIETFNEFKLNDESNIVNGSETIQDYINSNRKINNNNKINYFFYKIDYLSLHSKFDDKLLDKYYINYQIKNKLNNLKNIKYFQHKTDPRFISSIEPLISIEEIEEKIIKTYTKPNKFNDEYTKKTKIKDLVSNYFNKYNKKIDLFETIKFIFNTYNELLYFRIRNNKLECAYHLYNPATNIDWLKYLTYINNSGQTVNLDNSLIEIMSKTNNSYYTLRKPHFIISNNCLLGFDAYNYFEGNPFSYVVEFNEMLQYTIEKFKNVPDSDIIINRKDFAYLRADNKFAYDHLFSNDSINFDKFYPIGTQSVKHINLDIPIPSADEWKAIKTKNNIVEWKYKKPIALFRGGSTGCGITIENNPRLKLAQLSYEWTKTEKKNLIDVKMSKIVTRIKAYKQFVGIADKNKLKHLTGELMNFDEQSKYKYIFNIEGNAQAYRYGTEFRKKSVILNVESEFKMWFEPLLKENRHFILIKNDYSDLYDKLLYLNKHDDISEKIALNGYKFSKKYISKKRIAIYWYYYMININKLIYN
jgi:hypothetical protein